tara:strand:+ start:2291 stop:2629 length:339 start_codon:yes stop_codon:yes gene_type:complete
LTLYEGSTGQGLTPDDIIKGNNNVKTYIKVIDRNLRYYENTHVEFSKRLRKTENKIQFIMDLSGNQLANYTWNANTGRITLQPRDAISMHWGDFKFWQDSIREFIYEITGIS